MLWSVAHTVYQHLLPTYVVDFMGKVSGLQSSMDRFAGGHKASSSVAKPGV